ncbi:MAG: Nif3-like dinuclear metal center hexameric protein [Lachnospiraceae bacterium]|nr:Nif3-like dinuclear metal center hexameric protein [Lachnospiraceae bacterium]
MKCYEIIEKLESLSPTAFAEEWDNIGLLVGRRDKEVEKVYIALDATDNVIEEAVHIGADLLLTHHPLIFKKISRVNTDDFIGRRVCELIRNDISYYAMHTNFDVMGMADAAADMLFLKNRQVLNVTYGNDIEDDISREGCGRVGKLEKSMSVAELAELVKKKFHVPNVRVFGDLGDIVETAAVMPGSGGGYIRDALNAGADVMITGDVDHHEGIDAVAQGIAVIDAGHYGIEKLFISYMEEFIKRELPEIQIYKAEIKEPFVVI